MLNNFWYVLHNFINICERVDVDALNLLNVLHKTTMIYYWLTILPLNGNNYLQNAKFTKQNYIIHHNSKLFKNHFFRL